MSAKLAITALGMILLIPLLIAAAVHAAVSVALGGTSSQPSPTALADILGDYLALYRQAATVCPGLDWTILAAIGKVETDHGRSRLPGVHTGANVAGAGGPMQFLQPTFATTVARHPLPPGGANPPSRYDPHDAIYAAAYYLCDSGAGRGDLHAAIFAYNHADSYVRKVLDQAKLYAAAVGTTGDCNTISAVTRRCVHRDQLRLRTTRTALRLGRQRTRRRGLRLLRTHHRGLPRRWTDPAPHRRHAIPRRAPRPRRPATTAR